MGSGRESLIRPSSSGSGQRKMSSRPSKRRKRMPGSGATKAQRRRIEPESNENRRRTNGRGGAGRSEEGGRPMAEGGGRTGRGAGGLTELSPTDRVTRRGARDTGCPDDPPLVEGAELGDQSPSAVAYPSRKTGLPLKMVLRKGLEPLRLTAHAPQTCVSTNSTT